MVADIKWDTITLYCLNSVFSIQCEILELHHPIFFYLHFSKGKLCHTCATILILRLSRLNNVAKVINKKEKSQWSCLSCPIDFSRVWHTLGCIEHPVLSCFLYLSSLGIC